MRLLWTKVSHWKAGELLFLLCTLFFMTNTILPSPTHDECPPVCSCNVAIGVVSCDNKGLKEIPHGIPSWVTRLFLRSNRLSRDEISSFDFSKLPKLEELDLSGNKLLNLTADFSGLYFLRKISLEHCSLSSIPHIRTVSNVTHLLLSHNAINNSDNLKTFPSLLHLDLSFNKLRQIKNATFSHQKYLKYLNLQKNRIPTLSWSAFSGLSSIDTLDLSRCKIRSIVSNESSKTNDICFGNLQTLKTLNLSQNMLTHINSLTFAGMCSLQTLLVDRNRISRLSDGSFYGPKALKTLILDYNHIGSIKRGWLFTLEALETLSVAHNNLASVESDGWKFCTELIHLNLSYNRLLSLSSHGFLKLSKLETLGITDNRIAFLEDFAFDGLEKLISLDLSNNMISSSIEDIDGAFLGLDSIQYLSLRDNRIRSLSASALDGLESIVTLDLRHNEVTSIQNHTFDRMAKLKTLRIISASFLCDCQLAWFPMWLMSTELSRDGFQYTVEGSCFHPPALKGKDILNISSEEFFCVAHPIPVLFHEPASRTALVGENITLECSASATYSDLTSNMITSTLMSTPSSTDFDANVGQNNDVYLPKDTEKNPLKDESVMKESVTPVKASTVVDPPIQRLDDSLVSEESRSWSDHFPLKADEPKQEPNTKKTPPQRRNAERINIDEDGMTVTWRRGQEIVQPGSGIEIRNVTRQQGGYVFVTSLLELKQVTSNENGKYSCIISNNYGNARSKPAELVVNEFPRFTKIPMNVTVVRNGSYAILNCSATGQPPPQIQWQKDGGKNFPAATERRLRREQTNVMKPQLVDDSSESIMKGGGGMFLKTGNSGSKSGSDAKSKNDKFAVDTDAPLDFAVVLAADAGEYECVAESSVGRIVTKAMLIVEMPPSFAKPLMYESETTVGTSTVIQCIADARPDPEIQWSFNGFPLNLTERHFLAADGQMLIITSAEKNDAGSYTCVITNRLGAISHTMTLRIMGGDSGFFSTLFSGEVPFWPVVVTILIAVFLSVVVTALSCHFFCKRKQDKAASTTTGMTDLEPPPLDANSLVSTDESMRKGQSSQSIHLMEYDSNAGRATEDQHSRVPYGGSASMSDIAHMQILQSPSATSTTPLYTSGFGMKPLVNRSQSSTAIRKHQTIISRFRSDENFKVEEHHQMYSIPPKRIGGSRPRSPPPITFPSATFAKKAAGDENYEPVLLKRQRSRTVTPPSLQSPANTPGGQTGTHLDGRSSVTKTLIERKLQPEHRTSTKKTERSKKSERDAHKKEQNHCRDKPQSHNGKLPNNRLHCEQESNHNHLRHCSRKNSFARGQVHEPLDRRKYISCSINSENVHSHGGVTAPEHNHPTHESNSSGRGPTDFSSDATLASEASTLLHRSGPDERHYLSLSSDCERVRLLAYRPNEGNERT